MTLSGSKRYEHIHHRVFQTGFLFHRSRPRLAVRLLKEMANDDGETPEWRWRATDALRFAHDWLDYPMRYGYYLKELHWRMCDLVNLPVVTTKKENGGGH